MLYNLLQQYNLSLNELEPAFLHISYANLNGLESNERLEFLGDSIINFFTTLELMEKYKNKNEGDLTKIRARMVSSDSLSAIFKTFKLNNHLKIIGASGKKIEANTVEAVVAQVFKIFESRGEIEKIKDFVNDFVLKHCLTNFVDYKSEMQEYLQKNHQGEINYLVEKTSSGFKAEIICGDKKFGTGMGKSKKSAEQNAAKNAIEKLGIKH